MDKKSKPLQSLFKYEQADQDENIIRHALYEYHASDDYAKTLEDLIWDILIQINEGGPPLTRYVEFNKKKKRYIINEEFITWIKSVSSEMEKGVGKDKEFLNNH